MLVEIKPARKYLEKKLEKVKMTVVIGSICVGLVVLGIYFAIQKRGKSSKSTNIERNHPVILNIETPKIYETSKTPKVTETSVVDENELPRSISRPTEPSTKGLSRKQRKAQTRQSIPAKVPSKKLQAANGKKKQDISSKKSNKDTSHLLTNQSPQDTLLLQTGEQNKKELIMQEKKELLQKEEEALFREWINNKGMNSFKKKDVSIQNQTPMRSQKGVQCSEFDQFKGYIQKKYNKDLHMNLIRLENETKIRYAKFESVLLLGIKVKDLSAITKFENKGTYYMMEIDVHGYSLLQFKQFFQQLLSIKVNYEIQLICIHGYSQGTAIKDYLGQELHHPRIKSLMAHHQNDGRSDMIFKTLT